ncbi:MAG: hypothetical protein PVH16_01495, partial [Thioalkalispiraceae bacterium]
MQRIIKIIIGLVIGLSLLTPAQATTQAGANNRQPLILGVLPFRSPVALLKRFAPLRDHLQ